jgi:hypothetical protein
MHQVKIFHGTEDRMTTLEGEVNKWLRESGAKVVNVFGNMAPQAVLPGDSSKIVSSEGGKRRFAPSDVFLCVVYET